ncbi:MAG: hypothetical protein GWP14_03350 [Actinobacteria bacterium]|nr:hypothetical protein [Actinomycetota bacterium]
MDYKLLREGKRVAHNLNRRVQMTIPSVLAEGEAFSLRLSVFGPDALPCDDWHDEILFHGSEGIEGVPRCAKLTPKDGGLLVIDGLKAVGPNFAAVRARSKGI